MRKRLIQVVLGVVGLFVVIQLVPYGRDHDNPTGRSEPAWPSPEVRALAVKACFDCHSNETKWPWYSNVAPVSWLVTRHVNEGRGELNFSEFGRSQKHAKDAAEELRENEMPPPYYFPTHPEAKLTDAERQQLVAAFEAMFGKDDGAEKHD